jgi:hypothetical protein
VIGIGFSLPLLSNRLSVIVLDYRLPVACHGMFTPYGLTTAQVRLPPLQQSQGHIALGIPG